MPDIPVELQLFELLQVADAIPLNANSFGEGNPEHTHDYIGGVCSDAFLLCDIVERLGLPEALAILERDLDFIGELPRRPDILSKELRLRRVAKTHEMLRELAIYAHHNDVRPAVKQ